jgi:PhzF family phenazine biosynthesis protein
VHRDVRFVSVFSAGPGGGNPVPVVVDATGMSDREMRDVARGFGHESTFVLPPPAGSGCEFALRYWVPHHEMSMCGHATVGTPWLLARLGMLGGDRMSIWTPRGPVTAHIVDAGDDGLVEITQPRGWVEPVRDADVPEILSVLGITADELAPLPLQNACTSRVKTLVPVASVSVLDDLCPDFGRIRQVCDRVDSTGLYPYAPSDLVRQVFDARQFPRSSGYPEDPATGVAAAALSFGLLHNGLVEATDRPILVRQGRAMGRPSQISLRFAMTDGQVDGCWLGGSIHALDSLA